MARNTRKPAELIEPRTVWPKQETRFFTSDGSHFVDAEQAKQHQMQTDFAEWLENELQATGEYRDDWTGKMIADIVFTKYILVEKGK